MRSCRTLLSFNDIRNNKYYLETWNQSDLEYVYVTHQVNGLKFILERFKRTPSGLYINHIHRVESYLNEHLKCIYVTKLTLWHKRLGHPGSGMMHHIIHQSHGNNIEILKIPIKGKLPCHTCPKGKLVIKSYKLKVDNEAPSFLERIQGDIYGPNPLY